MHTNLTWQRLATGDALCHQHPILLVHNGDTTDTATDWTIAVPHTLDAFGHGWDHWLWTPVIDGRAPLSGTLHNVQNWVHWNLDRVVDQVATYYDGTPATDAAAHIRALESEGFRTPLPLQHPVVIANPGPTAAGAPHRHPLAA